MTSNPLSLERELDAVIGLLRTAEQQGFFWLCGCCGQIIPDEDYTYAQGCPKCGADDVNVEEIAPADLCGRMAKRLEELRPEQEFERGYAFCAAFVTSQKWHVTPDDLWMDFPAGWDALEALHLPEHDWGILSRAYRRGENGEILRRQGDDE